MAGGQEKAKAKGRKIGRGIRKNAAYKSQNRRDRNKARRIQRLTARFPKYRAPGWKASQMKEGEIVRDK